MNNPTRMVAPSPELWSYADGLALGRKAGEAPDVIEALSRNARGAPARTAVESGGRVMSYAELDESTNALARRLRSLGVEPGSRVAVAMPRGIGELSALVATLKAGGAYVPVDPGHPASRVQVILEDAQPQLLVAPASSPLRGALPAGVPLVVPEDVSAHGHGGDGGPLEGLRDPEQLAYILFTSGSTGRPKGVEISRRGFSNFLQSMAFEPGLAPSDRVLAVATATFDIAGLELFLPLYVGAAVVIADRSAAADPLLLRALIESSDISLLQATPARWRLLLDAGWKGAPALRMLCGGEPMSHSLARRLLECGAELWNVYGPTETTVWSTLERVLPGAERITVGHPIDNASVSLRDGTRRLEAAGEIGEICIGGPGVGLGYRGRPDLTAERFILDAGNGERYFRTGDLGRFLPDGQLECLGRMDYQVKVRGFRIEPGEVESQLRSVPGVSEVLVVALEREEEDPQLAAYWVGTATREDLYRRARESLPAYMVPSAYVRIEAFPLSTNGKIDRKRLPRPESVPAGGERGLAPRTEQESLVASIWRDALGLPFVPVDVDFFSLGGTSIRAIQVHTRVAEALGVDLPLNALYECPTIESIVSRLGETGFAKAPIVSVLGKGGDAVPWFGLLGIGLFEDVARALAGSYSLIGIHVPTHYVPGVDPFPTVQELARRYVAVIRERQPTGPYYLLGLCHGGIVAFEAAAQLEEEGETVGLVVLLDAELPLARRTLPAVRARHILLEAIRNPGASVARAFRKIGRSARRRTGREAPGSAASGAPGRRAVNIPLEGADVDADIANYEKLGRRVGCEVLTIRATASGLPPWLVVSEDLGWTGRARRVTSLDVASSHLGILHAPHAAEVAGFMAEARRRIEAESAE